MPQYFQVIEQLDAPFYAVVERGLVFSGKPQIVQAEMRKIEFILNGRCNHHFEGEMPRPLEAGDALIVPCRVSQFYQPLSTRESGHMLSLIISFDNKIIPFKGEEKTSRKTAKAVPFIEKYFYENRHISQIMDAVLMETLSQIRQEAEAKLPGFRWRISGLCNSAVVQLARNLGNGYSSRQAPKGNRGTYLVSCAREYIAANLSQNITLEDVADHLQVSREHLARTFKRVTGNSLFNYVGRLRLEQAKLELLNSDRNVTEIARECGFSSTALFCRNFKQYTEMTPLDYRDKLGSLVG